MRLFDLHCDTLYKIVEENSNFFNDDYDISVNKALNYKPWIECVAIWVPDEVCVSDAFFFVEKARKMLDKQIKSIGDISLIENKAKLNEIAIQEKSGFIFTVENGKGLGGKLENIKKFHDMGVKILTLTWNEENEIGTGNKSKKKYGLSEFGKDALRELEKYNIVVDISHASDYLFYDVASNCKKTFIATHSNSRKICNNLRNLTDEQFNIICKNKGVVGLNFYKYFLEENGNSDLIDIVKHCEHFLSLGGEDCVCIGSDFDGADMGKGMKNIKNIYNLKELFLKLNYKETLIDKIFFQNAYHFLLNFDI